MFFHTSTGALQVAIGEPPANVPYNSGYAFTNLERMYVIPWDPAAPLPSDTVYYGGFARSSKGALYIYEGTPDAVQKSLSVPARTINGICFVSSGAPDGGSTFTAPWGMVNSVGQLHIDATFGLGFGDLGAGVVSIVSGISGAAPTFTRATSAWTNLSNGNLGLVASGSPRSYYTPGGVYLGYLAEGARTNLCQRGEDFANVWTDVGTPTLSANTTTIGALDLSTVGDDSAAALEGKIQTVTFTADAVKAISLYVKQGTSTSSVIRLRDTSGSADRLLAAITWSGGVPVVTMTTGTDLTGTPQQQGSSGVYRLSFATTAVTAANTNSLQIYPATNAALDVAGVGTIQVGGVQAENATFPSSLIRTPGSATVTRNADVLTYPTTGWFNAATGTFLAEFGPIPFNDSANSRVLSGDSGGETPISLVSTSVVAPFDGTNAPISNSSSFASTKAKSATAYGANFLGVSLNGTAVVSDAAYTGTILGGTLFKVGVGNGAGTNLFGTISSIGAYPERLPNTQLQSMTTL